MALKRKGVMLAMQTRPREAVTCVLPLSGKVTVLT